VAVLERKKQRDELTFLYPSLPHSTLFRALFFIAYDTLYSFLQHKTFQVGSVSFDAGNKPAALAWG